MTATSAEGATITVSHGITAVRHGPMGSHFMASADVRLNRDFVAGGGHPAGHPGPHHGGGGHPGGPRGGQPFMERQYRASDGQPFFFAESNPAGYKIRVGDLAKDISDQEMWQALWTSLRDARGTHWADRAYRHILKVDIKLSAAASLASYCTITIAEWWVAEVVFDICYKWEVGRDIRSALGSHRRHLSVKWLQPEGASSVPCSLAASTTHGPPVPHGALLDFVREAREVIHGQPPPGHLDQPPAGDGHPPPAVAAEQGTPIVAIRQKAAPGGKRWKSATEAERAAIAATYLPPDDAAQGAPAGPAITPTPEVTPGQPGHPAQPKAAPVAEQLPEQPAPADQPQGILPDDEADEEVVLDRVVQGAPWVKLVEDIDVQEEAVVPQAIRPKPPPIPANAGIPARPHGRNKQQVTWLLGPQDIQEEAPPVAEAGPSPAHPELPQRPAADIPVPGSPENDPAVAPVAELAALDLS